MNSNRRPLKSPNDIVQELRRQRRNKISITKARDHQNRNENNGMRRGGKRLGQKFQRNDRNERNQGRESDSIYLSGGNRNNQNSGIRKRRVKKFY
jgi:hypothetical protein